MVPRFKLLPAPSPATTAGPKIVVSDRQSLSHSGLACNIRDNPPSLPSSSLERDFCRRRQTRQKRDLRRYFRAETGNQRPPYARNGRKSGPSASALSVAGFGRARTWDPLIKSHAVKLDFSSEFSQLIQNLSNRDQRLTANNPTGGAHQWSTHPRRHVVRLASCGAHLRCRPVAHLFEIEAV